MAVFQNLMCAPPASTSVRSEPTATSIRLANLMPYLLPLLSTAAGSPSQRSISPLYFIPPPPGGGSPNYRGSPDRPTSRMTALQQLGYFRCDTNGAQAARLLRR
jgi:hypothetical protein